MSRPARRFFSRPISTVPEPRDPRSVLIRRQTQVEFLDDALPTDWWQCLALGDFQLMNARLVSRTDGSTARQRAGLGHELVRPRRQPFADRPDQSGGPGRTSSQRLWAVPRPEIFRRAERTT